MKNSIPFFVLCLMTLSFLACEKDNLQPVAGDNFYDQTDIQDVLADDQVSTDNFYDQSDIQDILADDKAVAEFNALAQRSTDSALDDQRPDIGITESDLIISRISCNENAFAPGGGFKLLVHDPNDRDMNKYNSREYRVMWTYSDGIAVSNFNGISTECLCDGKIKVIVHDYTTNTSATISKDLSGSCGLNERLPEIEVQRARF